MGEDTSTISLPCEDGIIHTLNVAESIYSQESGSMCTVILDSSDVKFIPMLPVEAGEEVVMYESMDKDVKVEIDVCSDGYQDVYSEVCEPPELSPVQRKPRQKNSRQGPHKCRMCPKTFAQVINLVTHERIHTGEKPYKCTVCMKPFSQQPNLWKHMRTHTGERPYQCMTCNKRFTQQANLTKHIRIHTGERPYGCQYCGKRFTQQANMIKHVRLHTGERPYHCRLCTKTFVQQSNLDRHERTHTGVKPFRCEICHDTFAQNAHLAKHVRTIHKRTGKTLYLRLTNTHEELSPISDEIKSEPTFAFEDCNESHETRESSTKFGIPVLYCTKTGRIIKRVD